MSNEPTRVGGGSNQSEIATRPPLPPFTRLLPETAVTKPTGGLWRGHGGSFARPDSRPPSHVFLLNFEPQKGSAKMTAPVQGDRSERRITPCAAKSVNAKRPRRQRRYRHAHTVTLAMPATCARCSSTTTARIARTASSINGRDEWWPVELSATLTSHQSPGGQTY